MGMSGGRIAVFGPSPMLSVTIEARGEGRDDVHCHPAGQGVWLGRMAGELGAWPVLCSLIGGETGRRARAAARGARRESFRLVRSDSSSGCYVTDRRSGEREVLAQAYVEAPSRHEADELVAATTAAALESDVLAICNPYPGRRDAARCLRRSRRQRQGGGSPGGRRPLQPSDRGCRGGGAGARQAQRLGAGGVHQGTGGHPGAPARRGREAPRPRRCERARDEGGGPRPRTARRRGLGARSPRIRGRLPRGLRRHDDGRDLRCARPRAGSSPRRWSWARPPAPSTSSTTASAPARAERSRSSAPRSICVGSRAWWGTEARGRRRGGSRPAPPRRSSRDADASISISLEGADPLGDPQRPSSMATSARRLPGRGSARAARRRAFPPASAPARGKRRSPGPVRPGRSACRCARSMSSERCRSGCAISARKPLS